MAIASIDMITDESVFEDTFSYLPLYGMESYDEEFANLGFETCSFVYNMGDLAILQFGFLEIIVFMIITKLLTFKYDKFKPIFT